MSSWHLKDWLTAAAIAAATVYTGGAAAGLLGGGAAAAEGAAGATAGEGLLGGSAVAGDAFMPAAEVGSVAPTAQYSAAYGIPNVMHTAGDAYMPAAEVSDVTPAKGLLGQAKDVMGSDKFRDSARIANMLGNQQQPQQQTISRPPGMLQPYQPRSDQPQMSEQEQRLRRHYSGLSDYLGNI